MIFEETKIDKSTYTFVIDGNYLAMRIAFATGMDFREDVEKHSAEYYKSLCASFSNLVNEYSDSIGKVMIVIDGRSWRKDVDMIVPALREHLPKDLLQYKANRNKDESPIDMRVVMTVFRKFAETMDKKFNVPLIHAEGAEGDDLLYVVSNKETQAGNKCLLYTSDGDISQLVNDEIYVLKQMPADRPNKIIVSESKREQMYPKTNVPKPDNGLHMFGGKKDVYDLLLKNFKEEDVLTQNAAEFLFLKSVSGDAKDNIHPTFLWKKVDSSNQLKEYKPTGMYIKKGLALMKKDEETFMTVDDLKIEHLYDKNFYVPLLNNVLRSTPIYPKIVDVMRTYKTNIKILLADESLKDKPSRDLAIMAVCGNYKNLTPSIVVKDWDDTEICIQEITARTVLEKSGNNDMDLKTLKSTKFPKPFLLACIAELPRLRPLQTMVKVYEQNVKMLHLNKRAIPETVLESSILCYEEKKNINCDMKVVTDFNMLHTGSASSSDIFKGIEGEVGEETNITVSDKINHKSNMGNTSVDDTDGIMSTVFGNGY